MSVAGQPGQNASERAGLVGREMLTVAHVAMLADLSDDRRDKKGTDILDSPRLP